MKLNGSIHKVNIGRLNIYKGGCSSGLMMADDFKLQNNFSKKG